MDIMRTFNLLEQITEVTNKMDDGSFRILYCMMAEEYCRYNKMHMMEFISEIQELAEMVNEEEGEYGR